MLPPVQKTVDADALNLAALPRDVLANILLRLPASDLRRFRRVYKEWRDVISDPSFLHAHMIHGPRAPTHTIVFYPGRQRADGSNESHSGGGFLFDEQWRLTARFTVDESAEMIGTCKGLLCFRNSVHNIIMVVEPFTGDSIVLPLPPTAVAGTCSTSAYCFGFDATTRRYKVIHGAFEGNFNYDGNGYFFPTSMEINAKQELHVFAIGADTKWRTVQICGTPHGVLYGDPASDDRAMYWYNHYDRLCRIVRFDLVTEKITSGLRRLVASQFCCQYCPMTYKPCVIGIRWFGELQDGGWSNNIDQVAHKTYNVRHPTGWCLPGPHGLKRNHMLLTRQKEVDIRACTIVSSHVSGFHIGCLWDSKPLIETGSTEEEPAEQYKFVRVHSRNQDSSEAEAPIIRRLPREQQAVRAFDYVPTVSPAPFALYLGTPLKDLLQV
ncbi:unnamed protein product [Alopecurus aequalis]